MLILPPGHAHELRTRGRLSAREKSMIAGTLTAVAALIIALVISIGNPAPRSGHGCIYLTSAANAQTGGQEIYQCGANARSTCTTALRPGAFTPDTAREVASECRKAGLPVGS